MTFLTDSDLAEIKEEIWVMMIHCFYVRRKEVCSGVQEDVKTKNILLTL